MTDRRQIDPDARTRRDELRALEALIDAACDAGVDAIQIRERDLDRESLRDVVRRAIARAGAGGPRILVNHDVEVARDTGAGLHLRSDDPPAAAARDAIGAATIVGRSIHQPGEAGTEAALDYVLFGPVFPTESKPGAPGAGLAALAEAVNKSRTPVLAIGGITPAGTASCILAGAAGVAAIGAFLPRATGGNPAGLAGVVREFATALAPTRRGAVE
ncbi:MAG TPA: thiamine phosphate synthase [Vicinamibacterales bacterium]|nr:thiamine phosphate synthase [Vicinamibacterales bacterium]